MKELILIACISQDRGIGKDGDLIWHIKKDMQHFRNSTLGKTVVMGSRTYLSLGRPLPHRTNIVLSRQDFPEVVAAGGKIFHDKAALDAFIADSPDDIVIIGGAKMYEQYLPLATKLLLTEVAANKPADTFFPEFDPSRYHACVLNKDVTDDGTAYRIMEYSSR